MKFFILHQDFNALERSENEGHTAVDWVKYGIKQHEEGKAPAKSSASGCEGVLFFFDGMGLLDTDPEILDEPAPSL